MISISRALSAASLPPADISPPPLSPLRLAHSPDCAISVKPAGCPWPLISLGSNRACERPRMSFLPLTLERLERESTCLLDRLAARPRLAAAALLALAVFTYLPGVFLLPPVDRTEIVYAQSSRGMLERGTLIDSSYEGERVRLPPHRHLLAAGGNGQGPRTRRPRRDCHLPAAVAHRRHPGGARHVVADAAAARRTACDHRGGAVRRVAHRGAAGDAIHPRRPAAARHRRRAADAAAALLRTPQATATRSCGWHWHSGRRRAAACCSMRWRCRSCR